MDCVTLLADSWTLISQLPVPADPLPALGSGWAGAGLLGLVLSWLLFIHLPNKDKQILELVKAKDIAVGEAIKSFREEAAAERASCERSFANLAASFDRLREGHPHE